MTVFIDETELVTALRGVAYWLARERVPDTDVHLEYDPTSETWDLHTGDIPDIPDPRGYWGTGTLTRFADRATLLRLAADLTDQVAEALVAAAERREADDDAH